MTATISGTFAKPDAPSLQRSDTRLDGRRKGDADDDRADDERHRCGSSDDSAMRAIADEAAPAPLGDPVEPDGDAAVATSRPCFAVRRAPRAPDA